MTDHEIQFTIFLIFAGAALLATLALYARQALIVAYILLGVLVGPSGLGLVHEPEMVRDIAQIGIMFLLFLLGLNLHPQKLVEMAGEATVVTLVSSLVFAASGYGLALAFGFQGLDALVIAATCMFSSTILSLKLLPATALHHRHAGEIIISVLLIQDLIAILIMLLLQGMGATGAIWTELGLLLVSLPALIGLALLLERYVLLTLLQRFDRIPEYIFLLAIGWCLGMAQLAAWANLSHEIGAFIAGVALAANPIARFIAESLRPLRDFFLVIFFVSLGVGFDITLLDQVLVPSLAFTVLIMALKPPVFRYLLGRAGEKPGLSWEIGARLGQGSEFSLLIAVVAVQANAIGEQASYLIQTTAVFCFLVSSYLIVLVYPTPIAVSDRLRQD